jgi:hypothetical protein
MKDKILVTAFIGMWVIWFVFTISCIDSNRVPTVHAQQPFAEQAGHIKILDSKLLNLGRSIYLISVDGEKYLVTDHPSFIVPVQER